MKLTPYEFRELLIIIYNMSLDEFLEMFGRDEENDPGDYITDMFHSARRDMFMWLCKLDDQNLNMVFKYVEQKRLMTVLKWKNK